MLVPGQAAPSDMSLSPDLRDHASAAYAVAAARRFARHGVDVIDDGIEDDRAALLG